jgi:hypothetical protein
VSWSVLPLIKEYMGLEMLGFTIDERVYGIGNA